MRKLMLALPLALVLSAPAVHAASQQEAAKAITEAVVANNKASKAGFEWRDTYKKLLGPAKKAYKDGDYAKAVKLSNTAKAHAELGLEQAQRASSGNVGIN